MCSSLFVATPAGESSGFDGLIQPCSRRPCLAAYRKMLHTSPTAKHLIQGHCWAIGIRFSVLTNQSWQLLTSAKAQSYRPANHLWSSGWSPDSYHQVQRSLCGKHGWRCPWMRAPWPSSTPRVSACQNQESPSRQTNTTNAMTSCFYTCSLSKQDLDVDVFGPDPGN